MESMSNNNNLEKYKTPNYEPTFTQKGEVIWVFSYLLA